MTPADLQTAVRSWQHKQCHAEKERWSLLNAITERLEVEKYPAELFRTSFLLNAGRALKLDPAVRMTRRL